MKFSARVRGGILLSILAMTLAACNDSGGDGDSGASDAKAYFRSLKGEANKVTNMGGPGLSKNLCLGCAELGAIINSFEEFETLVNRTSSEYEKSHLLGDARIDFASNTVVVIWSYHAFTLLPTIGNVQEDADKIRIFPMLCQWSPIPDGQDQYSQTWIAIPKTSKPIMVEPMTRAVGEVWPYMPPESAARCDKLAIGQVS